MSTEETKPAPPTAPEEPKKPAPSPAPRRRISKWRVLGASITQFILERVFPEAERIVAEDNRTRLPKEELGRFFAKLGEAPEDLP